MLEFYGVVLARSEVHVDHGKGGAWVVGEEPGAETKGQDPTFGHGPEVCLADVIACCILLANKSDNPRPAPVEIIIKDVWPKYLPRYC